MPFPKQERFTPEDLANRWSSADRKITVNEIDELIRTIQFTHIIVIGEIIGGVPLTRHLYFDRGLWMEDYGEKLQTDPAIRRKELEETIERYTKDQEKLGFTFDLSTLSKTHAEDMGQTWFDISPSEVVNFWNPPLPQKEWKRPNEPVQIYIPRSAVEVFEKQYLRYRQENAELKEVPERRPAAVRSLEDGNTTLQGLPWVKQARAIGQAEARKNKNLSLHQIAQKTHEAMLTQSTRGDGSVKGRGGRVPGAETIRRHALTGIKN